MFFISFSRILPLDEFFYVAKMQNHFKYCKISKKISMIAFRIMKNWRFDKILLCLKWFCYTDKLIEWQNWWKAYKKQTLVLTWNMNPFIWTIRMNNIETIRKILAQIFPDVDIVSAGFPNSWIRYYPSWIYNIYQW